MPPKKILLAEDDLDDQTIFFEFLHSRKDISLMPFAENGVVLMNWLDLIADCRDLPDLIILDQNMPKRNGLETLELLKTLDRYQDIPVLVYSTYTDDGLVNACSKMGAAAVMCKPLTKDGYNKMIDFLLGVILKFNRQRIK